MTESIENRYRIVVGADLSETGDHALREAVLIAKQLPAVELHITNVIPSPPDLHDARKLDALSTELRNKLDALREHVMRVCAPAESEPTFKIETALHVRLGEPAAALHQVAVDVDADLIVVGTHGRKGFEKLMLGSVAEELIRTARLPVMVAHPKHFEGLRHSDRPEAPRPGVSLHGTGLTDRLHLEFLPRTTHISGLV